LTWVNATRVPIADQGAMKHLLALNQAYDWRRAMLALAAVAAVLMPITPAKADDVGDPAVGRNVANAWCSNCHAFAGSKQAIATGAPSFTAIAANRALTPMSLRVFLQTPHERMPDLHLTNNEMDDLIAFILSSRAR
jgi:mono/diheme cytochrome c family protein